MKNLLRTLALVLLTLAALPAMAQSIDEDEMPALSTGAKVTFSDSFNSFNSEMWTKVTNGNASDVRVEGGVMKVEQNRTDKDTYLYSRRFDFTGNVFTISRRVKLHAGGREFHPTFAILFEEDQAWRNHSISLYYPPLVHTDRGLEEHV